ncbi:MAG: hypothetical protein KJ905_01900 [Nanoarchaeota archaeon]|nr:hypothetical protein [Nanoarchaeota archaeon]MBU1501507.1 hypothetical protein [Nanoarchaeota archaeon]MBU2459039.1 hypothetical protein [Nanoarchaeota archaeon]
MGDSDSDYCEEDLLEHVKYTFDDIQRWYSSRANEDVLNFFTGNGIMAGIKFTSKSKGRGRKRRFPKEVRLIKVGDNDYTTFNNGDDRTTKKLPWDCWAQEVYEEEYYESLVESGICPGDSLRRSVEDLFRENEKF